MIKKLLFTGALLSIISSEAWAADVVEPIVEEPVAVTDWTGPYIGLQGGYAWGDAEWSDPITGDNIDKHDIEGFVGGGHAGFNFQFNSIVLGIEGDANFADVDGGSICESNPLFRCQTEVDFLTTIRGRLGFLVTNDLLVYATGGVAFADVEGRGLALPDSAFNLSGDDNYVGWTAGGGIDFRLFEHVTVGAQALFVDLGEEKVRFILDATGDFEEDVNIDLDMIVVQGRVSVLF